MKKDINQEYYSSTIENSEVKPLSHFRSSKYIKRSKHQNYSWSDKVDYALERYVKWEHKPHIQKKIFKEHIEIPLRNNARSVLKKTMWLKRGEKLMEFDPYDDKSFIEDPLFSEVRKINSSEAYVNEIEDIVDTCISFFFTTLFPYIRNSILLVNDGEEKTIISNVAYFRGALYNELIGLNRERSKNSIGGKYWEELPDQSTKGDYYFELYRKGMIVPSLEKEIDNENLYINELLNYWDKNIEHIWNRSNQEFQRTVAQNVVELMRRSNKIKSFKVDSMRRYLRKMMGWEEGESVYSKKGSKSGGQRNAFNKVIRFMRDRNKLLRTQYNHKGVIDFYYM
jgi:hypothetical protein